MTTVAPPTRIDKDRPLRVHVVGNSTAVLVEPEHGPRDGGTYGEQLVTLLADVGVPTSVSHTGRWFGLASDFVNDYERDVRDWFPDVLVLNVGIIDCQPNALPTSIARHLQTWRRTSRTTARVYRAQVAPRMWRILRDYQRRAAMVDRRTHRLSPQRFVRDVQRLIDLARKDCGCLVLIVDIDPPGQRMQHWLPGIDERVTRYNALLADVAAAYGDDVRLVRASRTVTDSATLPDGLHRSVAGHRLTAELLRNEICDWLEEGGKR